MPCCPGHKLWLCSTPLCSNGFPTIFPNVTLLSYSQHQPPWLQFIKLGICLQLLLISSSLPSLIPQPLWGLMSCSTFTRQTKWGEALRESYICHQMLSNTVRITELLMDNKNVQGHVQGVPGSWHETTTVIHLFHLFVCYNHSIIVTIITLNG